jgi:hypothetical protein
MSYMSNKQIELDEARDSQTWNPVHECPDRIYRINNRTYGEAWMILAGRG